MAKESLLRTMGTGKKWRKKMRCRKNIEIFDECEKLNVSYDQDPLNL